MGDWITSVKDFSDLASGIQSLLLAAGILLAGIWSIISLRPFREKQKEEANLRKLQLEIEQQAVVHMKVSAKQFSIAGDSRNYISAVVTFENKGNREVVLKPTEEDFVTLAKVAFDPNDEILVGEPTHIPINSEEYGNFSVIVLFPGGYQRVQFWILVGEPGLYRLNVSFDAAPQEKERLIQTGQLDTVSGLVLMDTAFITVLAPKEGVGSSSS